MHAVIAATSTQAQTPSGGQHADAPEHGHDFHAVLTSTRAQAAPAEPTAKARAEAHAQPVDARPAAADKSAPQRAEKAVPLPVPPDTVDKTKTAKSERRDADEDNGARSAALGALHLPGAIAETLRAGSAARTGAATATSGPAAKAGQNALQAVHAAIARTGKDVADGQLNSAQPKSGAAAATAEARTAVAATQAAERATPAALVQIQDPSSSGLREHHARLELAHAVRAATTAAATAAEPEQGMQAAANSASATHDAAAELQAISTAITLARDTRAGRDDTAPASPVVHASASLQTGNAPSAPPPASATLPAAIGSTAWQQQLGQQLLSFTQRGSQQIELHLHPAELGPLQISLQVNQQTAQAHFFAAHAAVRDAVQQALPQLREALGAQGIVLGEALVGQQQQPPRDHGRSSHEPQAAPVGAPGRTAESSVAVRPAAGTLRTALNRGVDLYA